LAGSVIWIAPIFAYGHDAPALTPPELAGCDLSVCAVASLYGQVDLDAMYRHVSQDRICGDYQDHLAVTWPRWPEEVKHMRAIGEDTLRTEEGQGGESSGSAHAPDGPGRTGRGSRGVSAPAAPSRA
jgi:hypothetical protein